MYPRPAKQTAAKRDAAAAKAKGQLVDPLDILNAIFLKDPDASVWVAGQGNKLCAAYFRNGDCPNRRCKWSHAETLAPFGGPSATDATTEPPLEQVQTVGARLDGPVSKAEFNDASALAPVAELLRATSCGRSVSRRRNIRNKTSVAYAAS